MLPQLPVRLPLLPVPGPSFQSGNVTIPLHLPSQGGRGLLPGARASSYFFIWTTGTSQPQPARPGPRGFSLSPSDSA